MELFTNVDLFLSHMHETYGLWLYVVLGLIFFLESGVFFTGPFLPGDSLLFVAGATAAAGVLDPWAVILGSTVGALFGNIVGFLFGAGLAKDFSPTNLANGLIKKIFKRPSSFLTSTAAMQ